MLQDSVWAVNILHQSVRWCLHTCLAQKWHTVIGPSPANKTYMAFGALFCPSLNTSADMLGVVSERFACCPSLCVVFWVQFLSSHIFRWVLRSYLCVLPSEVNEHTTTLFDVVWLSVVVDSTEWCHNIGAISFHPHGAIYWDYHRGIWWFWLIHNQSLMNIDLCHTNTANHLSYNKCIWRLTSSQSVCFASLTNTTLLPGIFCLSSQLES